MIERIIVGASLAALVASMGWRARALTGTGAVLAACAGTLAVAAGWRWGILLILFFVASTALSRLGGSRKAARTRGIVAKRGARDGRQVLANGGLFAAAAAGSLVWPHAAWSAAALGALAAVTADTWGTEVGGLARREPRLVTNWRRVPAGTSGAVTGSGAVATVLGAAFIAIGAMLLGWDVRMAAAALAGVSRGLLPTRSPARRFRSDGAARPAPWRRSSEYTCAVRRPSQSEDWHGWRTTRSICSAASWAPR